ncbi:MAG: adenosylcobinamide-GDP ribazoletransferase [Eubacteriales bacterium]
MNTSKNIGRSFIICMAMYSIIPMPMIEWEKKNMKYTMCFLPLIGGIIGACMYGIYTVMGTFTENFQVIALLFIPIILSGGIHMDGWLDTCDAYFSYGDKEKKLEILKDPRTGAFGVLGAIVYFMGLFAVFSQLIENGGTYFLAVSLVYIISRSVGALCMILVPNARKGGLGASFSDASSQRCVCYTLGIWLLSCVIALWMMDLYLCIIILGTVFISLLVILPMYMRKFGGITGDLTGFLICWLELVLPLSIGIGGMIL